MTATMTPPPASPSPSAPSPPPDSPNLPTSAATSGPKARRSRRWLRLVVPFAIVIAFWTITGVVHVLEEPNRADAGTLAPSGTGRHGSSELAKLLRDKGISTQVVTSSIAAAEAAKGIDATIFVPAPDYLTLGFMYTLDRLAGNHRVVLVRPGQRTMLTSGLLAGIRSTRWATATLAPDCRAEYATRAGAAAVRHDVYEGDGYTAACYGGALMSFHRPGFEAILVGASDPFRNDRIAEAGNATLATELLSEHRRLIWVDVHRTEPIVVNPSASNDSPGGGLPGYRRNDANRTNTGDPTIDAFPAVFWAALIVLFAGAVLFAIARGRRLGPPVPEPLPVLVPAAEAVTGRGRLYQRIGARGASLQALRIAAISRLARRLSPVAGAAPERELATAGPAADLFVAQVAERANLSEATVRDVLYGQLPSNDDELVDAVRRLDLLVATVVGEGPDPHAPNTRGPNTRGGAP